MATSPFTYRDGLGRPLTWEEADNNFRRVEELHDDAEGFAEDAQTAKGLAESAKEAAETAKGLAEIAKGDAETAAQSAGESLEDLEELFLGAKSSDPSTDNAGQPLKAGAIYWNSPNNEMRVWAGSTWIATYLPGSEYLLKAGGTMSGPLYGTEFGAEVGGLATVIRSTLKDCAVAYHNHGSSYAINYENGSHQRWAPTGNGTLSITNWPPSGHLGELLIEGVNLGLRNIDWVGINWVLSDGSTSTDFIDTDVELQASGIDWILLWTRDSGTTKYGKVMR